MSVSSSLDLVCREEWEFTCEIVVEDKGSMPDIEKTN